MADVQEPPPAPPAAAPPAAPPPSGVSEPWAKSWIQPDFSLDHKALDRLPDHLKGLRPTLERQKDFEGVLMALDHAQAVSGKKALAPLPPNSTAEVLAERKALLDTINGVPKDAKEYGIAKPKDLPDVAWHQGLADGFAAWAQKNSVSPAAAKELMAVNLGFVQEQLKKQAEGEAQFWTAQQQAFEGVLKRENISPDRAAALVEKGAISLGLDIANEQTKTFLKGSDARLMALRHAIAIGESPTLTGSAPDGGRTADPMAAALDIQRNPANPDYAVYHNREGKFSRSQVDAVKERVNELYRQATAKTAAAAGRGRR